jgi:CheY-like chemotaxis protein
MGYLEQSFRHVADQKGLQFKLHTDSPLSDTMFTDITRLQQIMKNLLSNAFKFTAKGSVTLSVAPSVSESGERLVSFAVKDTGIGIPEDKQHLIFEAFQQADGTTSRKYGGTGLGLTISREIARLLGGRIEVASAPGRGSTFTLRLPQVFVGAEAALPAEASAVEAEGPVPPLPAGVDFSGIKVLVVDDDVRNIFAIQSELEAKGMTVVYAENGNAALQVLEANPDIAVVLMDTMMPELDGVSATRAIRDIPRFSSLPIVSLTAKAMKGDREKALAGGATDYVTKPVNTERLLAVMYHWLHHSVTA